LSRPATRSAKDWKAVGRHHDAEGDAGNLDHRRDVAQRVPVHLALQGRAVQGDRQLADDLLRPADPAKGNRKIVYEVNNRGRKLLFLYFMDATTGGNEPRTVADAGNALLLRQGYTLAWSGWDPDAPRAAGGLAMRAPAVAPQRPRVRGVARTDIVPQPAAARPAAIRR
jgi:hypothetical protein